MQAALARGGQYSGLPRVAALALALSLLLSHLIGWYATVRSEPGGFDAITRRTDYVSTLTGALIIHDGQGAQLYDLDVQHEAQNRVLAPYRVLVGKELLPYNHLPFEALLVTPLVGLPHPAIFIFWTLIVVLALGFSLVLMHRVLPMPRPWLPVVLLLFVSFGPLIRSFILGQNSPLVLLGLCGTYVALRRGNQYWAGAALLLLALKPQVLPIILLLLVLLGCWRALLTFAGLLMGLCLATMPLLGLSWPLQYARLLVGVAGWDNTGAIDPAIMHNWRGLATNLLGGWAPALITPVYLLLSVASAALIVLVWARSRRVLSSFDGTERLRQYDLLWALAGLVAMLTSLHLNPHDLSLLIFPVWICLAYLLKGTWDTRRSLVWFFILGADYILLTVLDAAILVIPSVAFIVAAGALLAWTMFKSSDAQALKR